MVLLLAVSLPGFCFESVHLGFRHNGAKQNKFYAIGIMHKTIPVHFPFQM